MTTHAQFSHSPTRQNDDVQQENSTKLYIFYYNYNCYVPLEHATKMCA